VVEELLQVELVLLLLVWDIQPEVAAEEQEHLVQEEVQDQAQRCMLVESEMILMVVVAEEEVAA
jgi:hypothetical protein